MPMNPSDDSFLRDTIRDMFESNKNAAALLRDSEADLARRRIPLLDLRTVPREQWDSHLSRELLMPPGVARYLAGELTDTPPAFPLTTEQVHAMEEAVEQFHGITEPYYAAMNLGLSHSGRAWSYVPEAAPYLSGFHFDKEEDLKDFTRRLHKSAGMEPA
jgi:hypothetical protein